MKHTHIITVCCMLATIVAPAAVGQESDDMFVSSAAAAPQKPIIAVPLFTNKTTTQTSRIAPGKYKSKAKYEATVRLDVDANAKNSRYIEEMDVEYADGEWQLPDEASEIATDAATSAIVSTRRFRVLSRSTPAMQAVEDEIATQGTGAVEANQVFSSLKSCNAKYLLLGRLNRFRVDRTEAVAYGIKRRQIVTSVSVDMQLVDVNTMDIIAGETATERIVVRLPQGVTTHTAVYDWEPVLREAISRCVPKFLGKMTTSSAAPDELETAAPMVDVQVTSTPEGADVEFNGNFVGNTPCTISVPAETGVITISAPGYEKWAKRIKPSANIKIAPKLKEKKEAPAPMTPPTKDIIIID